jgi:hypothetical protein
LEGFSRGLMDILSWISLEGLRKPLKTSERLAIVPAKIRAEYLSNKKLA